MLQTQMQIIPQSQQQIATTYVPCSQWKIRSIILPGPSKGSRAALNQMRCQQHGICRGVPPQCEIIDPRKLTTMVDAVVHHWQEPGGSQVRFIHHCNK